MPQSLGSSLVAGPTFRVNGVPTTPSIAPVITDAYYGNGALLSPLPSVGSPTSPGHYEIEVFTPVQTVAITGSYEANIHTDDTLVDQKDIQWIWKDVGLGDNATFSDGAKIEIDAIKAKTDLIGTAGGTVRLVVGPDGTTIYVTRNDDMLVTNNRHIDLVLPSGFPDMVLNQAVTMGVLKNDATTLLISGIAHTTRIMRFEFPAATVTNVLAEGVSDYSILEIVSSTRNTPYNGSIVVTEVRTSEVP